MKHRMYILLVLMFGGTALFAQKPATEAQIKLMNEKIVAASKSMQTLYCNFEQRKEMSALSETLISKGKMQYRNDKKLRWEYTSPDTYIFVLNNDKVSMQSGSQKSNLDKNSAKLFQRIIKIMLDIISGDGLNDTKNFTAKYFYGRELWIVELEPVQKEMKKMFAKIIMTFNVNDYSADKIEMQGKNSDKTIITLSNKKINGKIADSVFNL